MARKKEIKAPSIAARIKAWQNLLYETGTCGTLIGVSGLEEATIGS